MIFADIFEKLPAILKGLVIYYFATPLFWLGDSLLGWNFRVAWLDDPAIRNAYYLFCIACAVLCYWQPRWSALVGLTESGLNFGLLIISVMLPIFALPGQVTQQPEELPLTNAQSVLGFMLIGSVLIASIHQSLYALRN